MCEIGNGMRVVVAVRGGVNDSVATWVEQERRSRDKSGSVMRRQRSLEIASPIEHGEVRLCMMMWESMFNAINLSLAIVAFSFALIPGLCGFVQMVHTTRLYKTLTTWSWPSQRTRGEMMLTCVCVPL
ncbi:hypothetical protein GYH30_055344 [Glycine max]|nr:hypothetical protein GYH30_055344 [Glycine max]